MTDAMKETYLGDGLYAKFDGEYVYLRAPREHGDHWVALDRHTVLPQFILYLENIGFKLKPLLKEGA
jgi:hypothetical protein